MNCNLEQEAQGRNLKSSFHDVYRAQHGLRGDARGCGGSDVREMAAHGKTGRVIFAESIDRKVKSSPRKNS